LSLELIKIAQKLGLFEKIKDKLIRHPDPAAEKLAIVLGEISKIYNSLDFHLNNYLCIWFDETDNINISENRKILLRLEAGKLEVQMEESRGHCAKITTIYKRFLSPWFAKVFNTAKQMEIRQIFEGLWDMDYIMIDAIKKVAKWLSDQADEVLMLVDQSNYDDANKKIRNDRLEILPERREIGETIMGLLTLQAIFIEIAGAL